jgi:hypothetical protein
LGGRGRQISEFEARLVYKVSSRTARAIQGNLVSRKKKKKKRRGRLPFEAWQAGLGGGDVGKEVEEMRGRQRWTD